MQRMQSEMNHRISELKDLLDENKRENYTKFADQSDRIEKIEDFLDEDLKQIIAKVDKTEKETIKNGRDFKAMEFYVDKVMPIKMFQ